MNKPRIPLAASIFACLVLLVCEAAQALTHDESPQQKNMKTMQFDADKAVMIDEVGMVVVEKEGKLMVEHIGPKEARPKETADLDVVAGDEVGMAAGKKVSSVAGLRAAYDSTKPGEEFKIGLRRDGKAFIVSIRKMDEKDLPTMMVIKRDGPDNPNQDVRPALGVVIEQKEGKVVIVDTFPNAPKEMLKGDVITSVNGTAVKKLEDFAGVFDQVEVGGVVKFELRRGDKTVTVSIKRPKPQGQVIVK